MYRLPGEVEALEIMERVALAAELGKPVTVTFLKEKRDPVTRRKITFADGSPYYVKVTRTVEPYAVEFSLTGHPVAYVVDRSPNDEKREMYRTVRLDRVVVSRQTNRPRLTVHLAGVRYCQGMIDLALAKRAEKAALV